MFPAPMKEIELEMVRRHVRKGEGHLVNQRSVIKHLKASNLSTEEAEALLATFVNLQRQHEAHLARALRLNGIRQVRLAGLPSPVTGQPARAPV